MRTIRHDYTERALERALNPFSHRPKGLVMDYIIGQGFRRESRSEYNKRVALNDGYWARINKQVEEIADLTIYGQKSIMKGNRKEALKAQSKIRGITEQLIEIEGVPKRHLERKVRGYMLKKQEKFRGHSSEEDHSETSREIAFLNLAASTLALI